VQKSIITIERTRLISFLMEIEIFLLTHLPEFCEECSVSMEIQNIKQLLSLPHPNLKKYCEGMRSFVLNIRNCIRMRTSMLGNLETESTRIRIDQWTEMKVKFSNEKPKEELLMIASKLIDEVFIHLSEILLDITSSKKNYKERK